ncbi:hypothetical protein [Streptomyces sp. NPDC090025]|uniref:hypothetical protein n=1 Tax=Streptomyces sp. NPDC090025 TaxID=3365922 RepID=UPI0038325846
MSRRSLLAASGAGAAAEETSEAVNEGEPEFEGPIPKLPPDSKTTSLRGAKRPAPYHQRHGPLLLRRHGGGRPARSGMDRTDATRPIRASIRTAVDLDAFNPGRRGNPPPGPARASP